jgi:hypothetical protein
MSSAEEAHDDAPYSTAVVGGGPGGLGPLLWAAQYGLLDAWLEQGVALVERTARLGGTLGRYGICSDSLGGSYLECLEAEALAPAFHHLREEPTTVEMQRYRQSFPPLPLVDRYMGRIGEGMAAAFARHPASALHLQTTVQSVHLRADGTVALFVRTSDARPRTLIARSAIIALGGRQPWQERAPESGLRFVDTTERRVLSSNVLLTHDGLAAANDIIASAGDRRIVILGGSHSAYAVAWALLQLPAAKSLGEAQIAIVQRRPPRVFYPDRAAAIADFYHAAPGDICARTQRVNRMGGLRGHGRDMWRQIACRPGTTPEPRVTVLAEQDFTRAELQAMLDEAALVAPCLGYRSATLPVFDPDGRRLALSADNNGDAVGDDCRLLLADGSKLANVFGIGLGTGFRPTETMGCEPNFNGQANSLWLYQNDMGALIYHAIQAMLAGPPRAAVAA